MRLVGEGRRLSERRDLKLGAAGLAGLLLLGACSKESSSSDGSTSAAPSVPRSSATVSPTVPFEVTHKWSLPPRKVPSPAIMTPELCANNFWLDEPGKREPAVQANPLIIRVDGRCNTPLNDDRVGLYPTPAQEGTPSVVVRNGDALGVECYTKGQAIQDIRGGMSSSTVWLGVVTTDGQAGLVPETNAGYVDERRLRTC